MTLRSIVSMLAALVLAVPLADAAPSPSPRSYDPGDAFERYVRTHAEWQNPDAFMRYLRSHPNGSATGRAHPDGFANVSSGVPRGGLADADRGGDAFERYVRTHAEWQNPDAFMRYLRSHPNGSATGRAHPDGFANVAAGVPRGGLVDADRGGDAFERYVRTHAEWQNPDAFMRYLRSHPNGSATRPRAP